MTKSLIDRLAAKLGPHVALAVAPPGDHPLLPDEARIIARAIPSRQAEFAAGRAAARSALASLGFAPGPILAAPDRAPIWPRGIVGSITHTKGLCLAAVAGTQEATAIGIDAEQAAPLDRAVLQTVLTEDEQRQISALPDLMATAVFSAKEAVYKALSPGLDEIWGFDAMTIHLGPEEESFSAILGRPAPEMAPGTVLHGHLLQSPDHILTALMVPAH